MPDLHVNSVRYALQPCEEVSFENPQRVEFETDEARFCLADGTLTCQMKMHFADAAEARRAVEPAIRAWEVDADLRLGRSGLRFRFDGADVVDRTPPPPGVVNAYAFVGGAGAVTATGTVSVHVSRATYPDPPPASFRVNPDAERILVRYQRYLDGREPLQGMAHYCLTFVEKKARTKKKQREKAAKLYHIDLPVVNKMGELTSTRGDANSARKAGASQPLTGPEHAWLEAAVKMLIWRLGDTRSSAALPKITMADLPNL